jgi:hypothetical protein
VDFAVIVIALVTLIVAIPPAIVAMKDLGWIAAATPSAVPVQSYPSSSESPESDDGERVLLTLSPQRVATPGTVEHDLIGFEKRLPSFYQSSDPLNNINNLIWNPGLIRFRASTIAHTIQFGIVALFLLGIGMGVTTVTYPVGTSPAGSLIGSMSFLVGFLFIVGAIIIPLSIQWIKAKTVVRIVDEYTSYLRSNQINIGIELTQAKAMYGRRCTLPISAT